jgi:phage-related protein
VVKVIFDAVKTINLKITNKDNTTEDSFHIERFFHQPEGHLMCHYLMSKGLDNHESQHQFDFSQDTQQIYYVFFDSYYYIIEQGITGILPHMDSISDIIGWYMQFIHRHREFFLKLFP